jgi:SCY1-like protein 1
MGNSASALPFSIDNQIGAPQDHNGWALHVGKSASDGSAVSVFVGKKPLLAKTPVSQRTPSLMQLKPANHHYQNCRKLRHPQILKVQATLDTDNPKEATTAGATAEASLASSVTTGDLIIVTEPCIALEEWFRSKPGPEELAWGLECVVRGLHFLHNSANLAHGNLNPSSFYVTPAGDVKLWNFSLITPIGPDAATGGPTKHFQEWEGPCTPDAYRSPERIERRFDALANAGVHCMDSYSLGILIDHWFSGAIPQPIQKAVQRLQTMNLKMRPRLQPLLKCPIFDTPYQKVQLLLEEITVQPVEQKIMAWQNLGNMVQADLLPQSTAVYKMWPLLKSNIVMICTNESMLSQDLYRREGTSWNLIDRRKDQRS